jgi:hypothetical protein
MILVMLAFLMHGRANETIIARQVLYVILLLVRTIFHNLMNLTILLMVILVLLELQMILKLISLGES